MPRKKKAMPGESVRQSLPWVDVPSGLCGHINAHYFGPGECVCTLPKGHTGCHEGDYVNGDGETMRGAWLDAAGVPAEKGSNV